VNVNTNLLLSVQATASTHRRFPMRMSKTLVLVAALGGLVVPLAQAAVTPADAAATCKAEAQARYGNGDRQARVKFKGMFGGSDVRKVRIQVLPPEGKAFLAICEVNGRSGGFVSLAPVAAGEREVAHAGQRR
jgi:hypothetical protein